MPAAAKVVSISPAEQGWKAIFDDETQSRIIAWGLLDSGEIVGLVVDPDDRAKVVPAKAATAPGGSAFERYGFAL